MEDRIQETRLFCALHGRFIVLVHHPAMSSPVSGEPTRHTGKDHCGCASVRGPDQISAVLQVVCATVHDCRVVHTYIINQLLYLSLCLSIYLSMYPCIYLSVCLSVCLSTYLLCLSTVSIYRRSLHTCILLIHTNFWDKSSYSNSNMRNRHPQ